MRLCVFLVMCGGLMGQGTLFDNLEEMAARDTLTVAHRGASEVFPENTLLAFREAIKTGAPIVELDVHQTKDGVWVVVHDRTLDRTTDAREVFGETKVAVKDRMWKELQGLDAGSWKNERFAGERLPSLEQALAVILPDAVPMIERKGGSADALVALLQQLRVVEQVLVQSFDWPWLVRAHEREPRLVIGALSDLPITTRLLDEMAQTGARFAHWDHKRLTLDNCQELHRRGLLVCVYTVNPDVGLLGAAALGCDMVTTDRPARLQQLISQGKVLRPGR
ncbi:MAG: glycerophosphodiester phosphodiesterase family protein [Planctomycetota bacterium]|nr:glycerophosphodiester phosphodiesterase family protein [Planctomycetota bacterium]